MFLSRHRGALVLPSWFWLRVVVFLSNAVLFLAVPTPTTVAVVVATMAVALQAVLALLGNPAGQLR